MLVRGWLLEALLKGCRNLFWIHGVCYLVIKNIPVVECFISPATSMRAYCLSGGTWSAMKIKFKQHLNTFHASTLLAAHQSIPGYFSPGTAGMLRSERWSFKKPRENWIAGYCGNIQGISTALGTPIEYIWQHVLVMAYRGWTNRYWIIKDTCGPERTEQQHTKASYLVHLLKELLNNRTKCLVSLSKGQGRGVSLIPQLRSAKPAGPLAQCSTLLWGYWELIQ